MTLTAAAAVAALVLVGGCTVRVAEPEPLAVVGEPPQYVCLRAVSVGCIRGEWRCSPPLHLRAADDGRPRCVMPGGL